MRDACFVTGIFLSLQKSTMLETYSPQRRHGQQQEEEDGTPKR